MSARTHLFVGPVHGPTRRSAPTDPIAAFINPEKPGGDRAPPLQSTNAQCRFEIYQASPPSSPANQNTRNDRRHQSLPLPSPVPMSPASAAKRPRLSFGKSPVTVTPGWFPKEGPQTFLWSFQGGSGREIRNPSQNLSWEARGDILLIRKEYPLASRRPSSAALRPHRAWPCRGTPSRRALRSFVGAAHQAPDRSQKPSILYRIR